MPQCSSLRSFAASEKSLEQRNNFRVFRSCQAGFSSDLPNWDSRKKNALIISHLLIQQWRR
jgi:hypothetical protein